MPILFQNDLVTILAVSVAVVLLVVAFVMGGLLFKNKMLTPLNTKNQPANTQTKKIGVQLSQQALVSEAKGEITMDDCAAASNDLKSQCQKLAAVNAGIANEDYGACSKIGNDWQDICFYKITEMISGAHTDRSDQCAKIKDELTKSMCYKFAAAMLGNIKLCDHDTIDPEDCVGNTIYLNNKDGVKGCKSIKSGSFFSLCVEQSKDSCSLLGDADVVNKCQSWRLLNEVIGSKQKAICEKIPLENFKKVCEIYVDTNGGWPDGDKDGLNNLDELRNNLDPFTAEPDQEQIIYNRSLAVNFFASNIYDQTANNLSQLIIDKMASSTASSSKAAR